MKKVILTITLMIITFTCSITLFTKKMTISAAEDSTINYDPELRAAWVSYFTGDIRYTNQADYCKSIDEILDALEYYNMNAIIFHVRANHDAWYKSELNVVNSQLAQVNFDEFDPLEYVITESHKRGIEFHAWLNPYRLGTSSKYPTAAGTATNFSQYRNNPASKASNILVGNTLTILDPGIPSVREFLINTCLELAENYDIDAIHFDDYFYAAGINDNNTYEKYNTDRLSVDDFRRQQVDIFIKDLKDSLDEFNKTNHRFVQLGIAPTGVYKNADSQTEANTPLSSYRYDTNGNLTYPKGATLGCQMHYGSYLYCDTLKWVNNEWINYILPQTYWAIDHDRAHFDKLINWWAKAVKNKNVNLYAGMGIYMWLNCKENGRSDEAYEQLQITKGLSNVKGTSIYSYEQVGEAYKNKDKPAPSGYGAQVQMTEVKEKVWYNKAILPEIAGFSSEQIGSVKNFKQDGHTITFDRLDNAKFYIVYRDVNAINYSDDEIVAIFGSDDDVIVWSDQEAESNYIYDVVPLSYTNTLGKPVAKVVNYVSGNVQCQVALDELHNDVLDYNEVINLNLNNETNAYLYFGEESSEQLTDYLWTSSQPDVLEVNGEGVLNLKALGTSVIEGKSKTQDDKICKITINVYNDETILDKKYTVKFVNVNGETLKTESVQYGHSATPPENPTVDSNEKYIYTFAGWDSTYYNITENTTINAIYNLDFQIYHVIYKNLNGDILKEEDVKYSHASTPPEDPTMEATYQYTYTFAGWDYDYNKITCDVTINALYNTRDKTYYIHFNDGTNTSSYRYYHYEEVYPGENPVKDGYLFAGWYYDQEYTEPCQFPLKLKQNTTVYAKWDEKVEVSFYDEDENLIETKAVAKGSIVTAPDLDDIDGYKFLGWSVSGNPDELYDLTDPILEDCDLYAVYGQVFIVRFYDYNGKLISEQEVLKGDSAIAPTLDDNGKNRFAGWNQSFDNVNDDLDIHPVIKKGCSCKQSAYVLIAVSVFTALGSILVVFKKRNY